MQINSSASSRSSRCSAAAACRWKATAGPVRTRTASSSIGKTVVRLGLTWNDKISFVLTEHLQVKRLAFLDILKREDGNNEDSEVNEEEKFEIDFALMTGELSLLLADLVKALGGEKER